MGVDRATPERRLGFDIGGTSIKAGALGHGTERLGEAGVRLERDETGASLVEKLVELHAQLGGGAAVGVGIPGLLDDARGLVTESPNLPFLDGFPLRLELARRLGVEPAAIAVLNDANAAALGEHRAGGGRGLADFLFVTLGTGVGGGLVLDSELWIGAGLAGEIGHVKIRAEGPQCGCGRSGCLETFASATAAMRRARERSLEPDLARLGDAARAAPGAERELLEDVGRDLGLGLGAAVNLLDCRAFVFGGGFSGALDVLRPGIVRGLREGSYGARVDDEGGVALLPAELGADAGWIGAACAAGAAASRSEN